MFGEHRILSSADHLMWVIDPAPVSGLIWDGTTVHRQTRHPGRPWQAKPKKVPNHVADHYLLLSADELLTDVLRHAIKDIVTFMQPMCQLTDWYWRFGFIARSCKYSEL